MVRQHEAEDASTRRINDYLRSLKSNTAGAAALDDYLLERAAQELRAARAGLAQAERDIPGA